MTDHPQSDTDFELYALGALEGEEKQAFEKHLAECNECIRRLTEARGRITLFGLAAPAAQPAAELRERLLDRLPRKTQIHTSGRMIPSPPGRRVWALVSATIVLLVIAGLGSLFLALSNRRLERQLADLRAAVEHQRAQMAHERAMMDLLTAPDTMEVKLAARGQLPTCRVYCNLRQRALFYSGTLPPSPPGHTYQLWLVPMEGKPMSVGTFLPDAKGTVSGDWWDLPAGIAPKAFAVTVEPAGGRPEPSGPPVVWGAGS